MTKFNFSRKEFSRPRAAVGIVLLPILIIILLIILAILGITYAYINSAPPWWYTYSPPNIQTPDSVVITSGPNTINPGASNTYKLKVTYDNPISTTRNYIVIAEIYEDDIGDVRLDRLVRLRFPAGATSATATFNLTCTDPNSDGNYLIVGDNGSNTLDDAWEIFGYVKDQTTSYSEEGPNYIVSCIKP